MELGKGDKFIVRVPNLLRWPDSPHMKPMFNVSSVPRLMFDQKLGATTCARNERKINVRRRPGQGLPARAGAVRPRT